MTEKTVEKEVKEAPAPKEAPPAKEEHAIAKLIQKKRVQRAPKLLICGSNKIGKTTFASAAPKAIGILAEDAGSTITGDTLPLVKTLPEVYAYLEYLEKENHGYKTLYLDSLDWLEPLLHDHVCRQNGWASIETPGYGRGYVAAAYEWRNLLNTLDRINAKGVAIILISHVKLKTITSPIVESYDSFQLKLHDKAGALCCEWADIIGFCAPKLLTTTSTTGFQQTTRAVSTGERLLYLEANPAYPSGNRYSLKDQPLDANLFWQNFANAIATK